MKRLVIATFLFVSLFVYPQDESNTKNFFLSIGKPWFSDADYTSKNYSISLNFKKRFAENFAYEVFYEYAQNNSYPDFFDNPEKLNNYLMGQEGINIVFNSLWSDIYTHSLGIKIHYVFVDNVNWFLSFNLGGGYYFTKTSAHNLYHYETSGNTIISYENKIDKDKTNNIFYQPGIQLHYTLPKNYIIGMDFNYHRSVIADSIYSDFPVIADYFNAAFIIGKRF